MPSQVRGREDGTCAEDATYNPPALLQRHAHVPDFSTYTEMYKRSVHNPQEFWLEVASEFYWKKTPSGKVLDYNFDINKGKIFVEFMKGAKTNVCYNILDRNVMEKNLGDKTAFFWEGNSQANSSVITYWELLKHVCKFANVLIKLGVRKGDRVAIYLPMIPELVYAMLACARIGAVHSIVFAGFSSESLCERILDSQCVVLVTADGVFRGEKPINLKQIADEALQKCKEKMHHVKNCVVVKHLKGRLNNQNEGKFQTAWNSDVDRWLDELVEDASDECEPEWLDAEDPLFILYTSGSTGKPKGVVHTVAGYLLYTALTFKYVFDYHEDDVYWSTADIGWITGHSYIVYGPLANGATSVMFEGIPTYPHVGRFWEIVEKYKVTQFYTAPTAIRLLMKYGNEAVQKFDLNSLKILGTVGEPINSEAWLWFYNVIGNQRCPIVDTFWQTETGGHVVTPLPAATPLKPGSATFPFFGVVPAVLNEHGKELEGEAEGYLVFKQPWPSIMRTLYGNHERYENTYFKKFPGYYVAGDGCRRDKDGYIWITGRIDDMLNVSVREKIGPIATPDFIQNAPGLPKTRSGKIMRRVLRQIARNEKDLGDISTLADPSIVEVLFSQRCEAAA
uniref:Acetyl-coenzyme A synthetase n=1 Tax=Xenopus tropicalis TaxID=8364 RepID=A0A6I8SVD4_XENTR